MKSLVCMFTFTVAVAGSFQSAGAAGSAQDIDKLRFLAGTWSCSFSGPNGMHTTDTNTYSFPIDGPWMQELGVIHFTNGKTETIMQMWGYDTARQSLVAVAFNAGTIMTKHLDGWENGILVGHYDGSDMLIELRPKGVNAFDWVTRSPDDSRHYVESCTR